MEAFADWISIVAAAVGLTGWLCFLGVLFYREGFKAGWRARDEKNGGSSHA